MFYKNKKPMTDREAAEELLKQRRSYGTFGLFWGPEPFAFMQRLGLFQMFNPDESNPAAEVICLTLIRIFNYAGPAKDEVYEITSDGKIIDHDDEAKDPEAMLSLKRPQAQAGWEIHDLVPDYGEKVESWISTQKDSS